jgi:hypothetical protein
MAASLADKLKLKVGMRGTLVNAPQGYADALAPLPTAVELHTDLDGQFDWIQVFVKNSTELAVIAPKLTAALKPVSLLWIAFPKGSSKIQTDLTRDKGWESLRGLDLKWINLVSVDDTWSAFSLRPYRHGEERQSFR